MRASAILLSQLDQGVHDGNCYGAASPVPPHHDARDRELEELLLRLLGPHEAHRYAHHQRRLEALPDGVAELEEGRGRIAYGHDIPFQLRLVEAEGRPRPGYPLPPG